MLKRLSVKEPSTSPLWTYKRVLITPHSSGGFVWQSVRNYYTELVIKNIEHLKNHETLENEVKKVLVEKAETEYVVGVLQKKCES